MIGSQVAILELLTGAIVGDDEADEEAWVSGR